MLTWDARWFAICSIGAWMLVVGFLVTIMSVFGMKLPVWMGFVLAVCLFGSLAECQPSSSQQSSRDL